MYVWCVLLYVHVVYDSSDDDVSDWAPDAARALIDSQSENVVVALSSTSAFESAAASSSNRKRANECLLQVYKDFQNVKSGFFSLLPQKLLEAMPTLTRELCTKFLQIANNVTTTIESVIALENTRPFKPKEAKAFEELFRPELGDRVNNNADMLRSMLAAFQDAWMHRLRCMAKRKVWNYSFAYPGEQDCCAWKLFTFRKGPRPKSLEEYTSRLAKSNKLPISADIQEAVKRSHVIKHKIRQLSLAMLQTAIFQNSKTGTVTGTGAGAGEGGAGARAAANAGGSRGGSTAAVVSRSGPGSGPAAAALVARPAAGGSSVGQTPSGIANMSAEAKSGSEVRGSSRPQHSVAATPGPGGGSDSGSGARVGSGVTVDAAVHARHAVSSFRHQKHLTVEQQFRQLKAENLSHIVLARSHVLELAVHFADVDSGYFSQLGTNLRKVYSASQDVYMQFYQLMNSSFDTEIFNTATDRGLLMWCNDDDKDLTHHFALRQMYSLFKEEVEAYVAHVRKNQEDGKQRNFVLGYAGIIHNTAAPLQALQRIKGPVPNKVVMDAGPAYVNAVPLLKPMRKLRG